MKNISKDVLSEMYLTQKLNPYEISNILDCDHKTVRRYLKLHKIQLRTASEYNYLPRVSHTNPTKIEYMQPKSIAAHIAYLCEGWHTNKTNGLYFCNTDPNLNDLMLWCLKEIYNAKTIRLRIMAKSLESAKHLLTFYPNTPVSVELDRKTPILRIVSGGKTFARDFIKNAYDIIDSLG